MPQVGQTPKQASAVRHRRPFRTPLPRGNGPRGAPPWRFAFGGRRVAGLVALVIGGLALGLGGLAFSVPGRGSAGLAEVPAGLAENGTGLPGSPASAQGPATPSQATLAPSDSFGRTRPSRAESGESSASIPSPPRDPPLRVTSLPPGFVAEVAAGLVPGLDASLTTTAETALEPGAVDRTSLDLVATYAVRATIGWTSRSLAVETRINLTNRSGGPVDHVLLNTVAGPLGRLHDLAVEVDGRSVRASLDDQTIRVPFGGVLPDGDAVEIVLRYRATVRSDLAGPSGSAWLFTRTNGILALYRWIPWLSREHPFARPNHGDPFVTVVSPQVRLELVADRPLRYAVNARRIATGDGGRRQIFVAESVRDVVLTAAPDYETVRGRVGETEIEVVARPDAPATTLLRLAERALGQLERRLGPYPYARLVVAESAGGYALEGPGIIWIPRGVAPSRLPYLVTHEIAHQWFYGLVGNDQATDPFADEAVTDFVTRHLLRMRRAPRCSSGRLDRPIYAYSATCYYERIYVAGANLLDDLRRRMGERAFWGALRIYLAEHRFGLGSSDDLIDALDAATPLDVRAFVGRLLPRLRRSGPSG